MLFEILNYSVSFPRLVLLPIVMLSRRIQIELFNIFSNNNTSLDLSHVSKISVEFLYSNIRELSSNGGSVINYSKYKLYFISVLPDMESEFAYHERSSCPTRYRLVSRGADNGRSRR